MHKDNVRKKKHASAYRSQKNARKGMKLIYIVYVNLGKTGFVERSRKFWTLTLLKMQEMALLHVIFFKNFPASLSHDLWLELCQCYSTWYMQCPRPNTYATGVYCSWEIFTLHFEAGSKGNNDIIDVKIKCHV